MKKGGGQRDINICIRARIERQQRRVGGGLLIRGMEKKEGPNEVGEKVRKLQAKQNEEKLHRCLYNIFLSILLKNKCMLCICKLGTKDTSAHDTTRLLLLLFLCI